MFHRVTIRVTDLAASERFYDTVLRTLGIERERVLGGGGSLSVVAGRPSENVHVTFRGPAAGVRLDPDGNRVEIVS